MACGIGMAACTGLAAALSGWTRKTDASLPCGRGQYAVPSDLQLDHRTQYPLRAARRREHRRLLRGLDRATGSAAALRQRAAGRSVADRRARRGQPWRRVVAAGRGPLCLPVRSREHGRGALHHGRHVEGPASQDGSVSRGLSHYLALPHILGGRCAADGAGQG
ncbi:hypothetical protein D3C72_1760740 [compost metagenome]